MKKIKKLIFFLLSFIVFSFLSFFFLWQEIYLAKNPYDKETKIFTIEKGQGLKEISANLEKEGIIKSDFVFNLYAFFSKKSTKLQAGKYQLSPSMTIPEIVEKFVKGEVIKEKITIVEGWNLNDIEKALKEKFKIQIVKLKLPVKDLPEFKEKFDFLNDLPTSATLEGFLFPDTYQFSFNVSERDILEEMLLNFDKKLNSQLREEIKRQKKTIFEIITMASLIEKEVRTMEDKKLVSGILWKRLKIGMPLQADATITYLTGKKTTEISIEETKIDSPYNTYKYFGLPPGPICNPGLDSILAAIYPQESDYLFYLSTPEGKTIFSKTLLEHNIARAKYLQ